MFLDLGITWDPRWSPAMVEMAFRFGYAGVAHSVTLSGPQLGQLQAQRSAISPCKLPEGAAIRSGPLFDSLGASLNLPSDQTGAVLQLRRLTLVTADLAQLTVANQAARLRPGFDLIAVRPTTEEVFSACCERGDCDVISLKMDEKLPFPLRRKDVMTFTRRGGFFEVEFAPALRDAGRRRYVFANMELLVGATRGGQNVFLSSAANDAMEMRSPHDLANFGAVLGLRGARSLQSVSDVPLRVLQRGALRRGCTQVSQLPTAHRSLPADDDDRMLD
mmetsp:Transcript_70912/g.197032  ORF Transcript_70912/g.197032 Transcript_70912/m.197032 type:complete len:276 (-) Transcript_70912:57-884(-)